MVQLADFIDKSAAEFVAGASAMDENFGEVEANDVILHIDGLLNRALEAVPAGDTAVVISASRLLGDSATLVETAFASQIVANENLAVKLWNLLDTTLVDETSSVATEAVLSVLKMTQSITHASGPVKDAAGEPLIDRISKVLMRDTPVGYEVQRCLATILINLIKGSKVNRNRMGDCHFIAKSFNRSSDFFFQLQCVELLYRIFRHNKAVLGALSELEEPIRRGIEALKNDETLVSCMAAILDDHVAGVSTADGAPRYLRLRTSRVKLGTKDLFGSPTTLYFCRKFAIVMIPGSLANNVTLDYSFLKKVTISKDGASFKMTFNALPPNALEVVQMAESVSPASKKAAMAKSGVIVGFEFEKEDMAALKAGPVSEWINGEIQAAAATAAVTASAKRGRGGATSAEAGEVEADEARATVVAAKSRPTSAIKADEAVADIPADNGELLPEKRSRLESVTAVAAEPIKAMAAPDVPSFDAIRSAAMDGVARKRRGNTDRIEDALRRIQADIDATKAANARDRDAFQAQAQSLLQELSEDSRRLKERVRSDVTELNDSLQTMQGIVMEVDGCVEEAREQLRTTAEAAQQIEEEHLRQMKANVDSEMRSMQDTLNSFITAAEPLRFLTAYISSKMESSAL